MAEQTLTVTNFGDSIVWQDAHTDGHAFHNTGHILIYVSNASGENHTVQFTEQTTCEFGHDLTHETESVSSVDGLTRLWVTKNIHRFNDSSGDAHFTVTSTLPVTATDLQFAAVDHRKR